MIDVYPFYITAKDQRGTGRMSYSVCMEERECYSMSGSMLYCSKRRFTL